MTQLRKALLGYDVKQVYQHLRRFKFLSELEISELEQLIVKARKELALHGHESTPPENIELTSIVETSVGLEPFKETVELFDEIELIETDELVEEVTRQQSIVQPVQLQRKSKRMGRLLMFQRKMDISIDQDEQQSTPDQIGSFGYWESIDHYLMTPVISEELLSAQTVITNSLSQSQQAVSNWKSVV